MFELNTYTIFLWITGILIFSFDFVVYSGSKNKSSILFAFFSSFVALWSISYGFIVSSTNAETSLYLMKINHLLGMIASLGFVCFSISYPDDKPIKIKTKFGLIITGFIFLILLFFTKSMIPSMFYLPSPDRWGWVIGNLYFLYCITFNFLWIGILYNIRKKISYSNDPSQKINQIFMFWGLAIGIMPPAVLNIILPFFGIYGLSWTGPIFSALWIFIIGYSIIRYRQMNVKVIITEVLAIAMTVIFFINIFIKAHLGIWENVLTFLIFLVLAIYLIRGVLIESKQKEQLRILNETLEQKVQEQTIEIRKAYELEKKARRELEKLNETKDQFIMITQHHLRTPVNNIKSKIESILKRQIDLETKEVVQETNLYVERLTKIVNDFLSISTIKPGGNILNLSKTNLKSLIDDIIAELKIDIEQKKINIIYQEGNDWPLLNIDSSKIRDALLIIIENAVRYNTTKGYVKIESKIIDKMLKINITDSGIGIDKNDQEKIFKNLFLRGEQAKNLNPIGMGVGLSVAKAIIKAHHGELKLQSEGIQKGTTVFVNIPINYLEEIKSSHIDL